MPYRKYALEPGGPRRLEIGWGSFSRKHTITLDGHIIGEISDAKAARKGKTFALPDGSALSIQRTTKFGVSELQTLRDGVPLPGSDSDPQHRLERAVSMIFFIAGLNIFASVLLILSPNTSVGNIRYDALAAFLTGVIYGGLGFFVRRRSLIALVITVIGFIIDSLGFLLLGFFPFFLLIRIFLLLPILLGFSAIQDLKRSESVSMKALKGQPQSKYRSFLDETDQPHVAAKKGSLDFSRRELAMMVTIGFLVVLVIGVVVGVFISRPGDVAAVIAAQPTQPAAAPTPLPITPTVIFPDWGQRFQLQITAQPPTTPLNLAAAHAAEPYYPGDLAWKKPVFARNYYADGYPSGVTGGARAGWRTADSTGTWMYVDLGSPQIVHQIVTIHFVDSAFTKAPEYYYTVSEDLKTWYVIADEMDTANLTNRFKPRIITLQEDVTTRYIGLYAANWGGGWGGVELFAVFPPEYEYTIDDLNALRPA